MSNLNKQEIKRKSVGGALSYFARTIFLNLFGLASSFILSTYLSVEEFGIYGFVIQIVGILVFFSDIGLAASLIQQKDEPTKEDYRTVFTVQQILSFVILCSIAIILATGLVQSKVGQVGAMILLSLGISFPLATLKTIPSVILERKLDFSKLVLPQIFEQITFNVILIILAISGYGASAYIYAILARSIIGVIVMNYLQKWEFGFAFNKTTFKVLLGFGLKFQLNDFLARIKDQLFFLFLGLVLPLKEFGYIQWAKNWSMYPYNLTVQNVMAITFPVMSRLQNDQNALKKAIEKSLFFVTLGIFPILVGISIFITPFIELFTRWQKWELAILSLIFFNFSIMFSAISTPLTNALNAIGKINVTLKLMIMWTVMTWTLTPVLLYFYGFNGVALSAFLISTSSVMPVFYIKKFVNIEFINQIWLATFGSIVMSIVGYIGYDLWAVSYYHLIFGIFVVGLSYLVSIFVLGKERIMSEIKSLR